MNIITELERLGYTFSLTGNGKIHYERHGNPDPATANRLLDELRGRKAEAIAYLQARSQPVPERVNINDWPIIQKRLGLEILPIYCPVDQEPHFYVRRQWPG